VNLFAENFAEVLARDYGLAILDALYAERCLLSPSPHHLASTGQVVDS